MRGFAGRPVRESDDLGRTLLAFERQTQQRIVCKTESDKAVIAQFAQLEFAAITPIFRFQTTR